MSIWTKEFHCRYTKVTISAIFEATSDPADGRKSLMFLTAKCLKLLQEGRAAKQDWLTATVARKLTAHEQEKLQGALELLARLVEE